MPLAGFKPLIPPPPSNECTNHFSTQVSIYAKIKKTNVSDAEKIEIKFVLSYFDLKEFNPDIFGADLHEWTIEDKINMDEPVNPDFTQPDSLSGMTAVIWNTIRDLHLELILMYHRVCLKLSALGPGILIIHLST